MKVKNLACIFLLPVLSGCGLLVRHPVQGAKEPIIRSVVIGEKSSTLASYSVTIGDNLHGTNQQCRILTGRISDPTKKLLYGGDAAANYGSLIYVFHEIEIHCAYREGTLDALLRRALLDKTKVVTVNQPLITK